MDNSKVSEAKEIMERCHEVRVKIESARKATEADKSHAEQRLNELQESLPTLLAGQLFDEVSSGEIAEVKAEITELEESINDAPFVIQGLQVRQAENDQAMTKASRVLERSKAEQRYETLKSQMGDTYDRWLDAEVRSAGHAVGKKQEAHELVEAWKYRLEHASTGRSL